MRSRRNATTWDAHTLADAAFIVTNTFKQNTRRINSVFSLKGSILYDNIRNRTLENTMECSLTRWSLVVFLDGPTITREEEP